MSDFIKQFWYPIEESRHIGARPHLVRRFDQDIVLWRASSHGKIHAFLNRCPHRGASLAKGKVCEGRLECPYHGARFQETGVCDLLPANGRNAKIPEHFRASVFQVQERHGMVWMWYGDGEPSRSIPDYLDDSFGRSERDHQKFKLAISSMEFGASFLRTMEASLDDHHFPFVHKMFTPRRAGPVADPYHCRVDGLKILTWGKFRKYDDEVGQGAPFRNCVQFPNITLSEIPDLRMRAYVSLCPIDSKRSWIVISCYQNALTWPILGNLVAQLYLQLIKRVILVQDLALIQTQRPEIMESTPIL